MPRKKKEVSPEPEYYDPFSDQGPEYDQMIKDIDQEIEKEIKESKEKKETKKSSRESKSKSSSKKKSKSKKEKESEEQSKYDQFRELYIRYRGDLNIVLEDLGISMIEYLDDYDNDKSLRDIVDKSESDLRRIIKLDFLHLSAKEVGKDHKVKEKIDSLKLLMGLDDSDIVDDPEEEIVGIRLIE